MFDVTRPWLVHSHCGIIVNDDRLAQSKMKSFLHQRSRQENTTQYLHTKNNVRAKDQRTAPILPIKQMNPKPDVLTDSKSEEKSQCESDSESITFNSDSESEETEISEDDQPVFLYSIRGQIIIGVILGSRILVQDDSTWK